MNNTILINKNRIFFITLFLFTLIDSMQNIYFFSQNNAFSVLVSYTSIFVNVVLLIICLMSKYSLKEFVLFLLIGIVLLVGYINSKMSAYLCGFMFLIAARNIDINEILKVIKSATLCTIIIAIFLYIVGVSNAGIARRGFSGFGFVHPNTAARIMMLYVLLWISEHHYYKLIKINTVLILGELLIFILTGSRTVLLTMTLLILCLPLFRKQFMDQNKNEFLIRVSEYANPILLFLTYISAKFIYDVKAFKILDTLTTNRIFLNSFALNRFGINLFGRSTDLRTNGTIYNDLRNVYWSTGATVDSAYMTSLLRMGLIPTILWTFGYVLAMRRIARSGDYVFFAIGIALCLETFMETGMLAIYTNFTFFFLTAKMSNTLIDIKKKGKYDYNT